MWNTIQLTWSEADFTWSEQELINEVIASYDGVDATTLIQPWIIEPWNPYRAGEIQNDKRSRLIKLICKVNGVNYDSEKQHKDFKITANHIKVLVKKMKNVDLEIGEQ